MRGSKVARFVIGVLGAWLVMSLGSFASGGDPNFTFTVDPSSGPPGTTVTITAQDCGQELTLLRASGAPTAGASTHEPGSGLLVYSVAGWGPEFEEVEGGTNDEFGIATATFQVPNVSTGAYEVDAFCADIRPCAVASVAPTGCLRATQFGSYAPGSFTVTAPATTPADTADPVEEQATTVG